MDLKKIVKEVKKQLPKDINVYENLKNWNMYVSLSGFHKESYFALYFTESKSGSKEIEIAQTTDNPSDFVEMIKNIDEDAIVTYYRTENTQVTI